MSRPGQYAADPPEASALKRTMAYKATFKSNPESTAEIGVGPSAWASGSHA